MNFKNKVTLHNVAELIPMDVGFRICRVPNPVREKMIDSAKNNISYKWNGVEIRFVIESGKQAFVTIYNEEEDEHWDSTAFLRLGDYQYGWTNLVNFHLKPGLNRIPITLPDDMDILREEAKKHGHAFSPNVVRLSMINSIYRIVDVEGDTRPPRKDELPKETAVFYGSSITYGSISSNPYVNFVSLCGKSLGVDVLNKGMAGSCFMEKEVIDYILSFDDAKFISVEVASNCVCLGAEEVARRTQHLVDSFKAKNTDQHLFVADMFLTSAEHDETREAIKKVVENSGCDRIHFIRGYDIIPDLSYCTADRLHPSIEGHHKMAQALVKEYEKVLK